MPWSCLPNRHSLNVLFLSPCIQHIAVCLSSECNKLIMCTFSETFSNRMNPLRLLIGSVRACPPPPPPPVIQHRYFFQRLSPGGDAEMSAWLSKPDLSSLISPSVLREIIFSRFPHEKLQPSSVGSCTSSSRLGLSAGGSLAPQRLSPFLRNTSSEGFWMGS